MIRANEISGYGVDVEEIAGYGIDVEKYAINTDKLLKLLLNLPESAIKDDFLDAYEDNKTEFGAMDDFFAYYCEHIYQNCIYLWSREGGLLADLINEQEDLRLMIFRYEDWCIYVESYIPKNEEEKERMLTIADIGRLFEKYLQPVSDGPFVAAWHVIHY